jgi:hypothetical protein
MRKCQEAGVNAYTARTSNGKPNLVVICGSNPTSPLARWSNGLAFIGPNWHLGNWLNFDFDRLSQYTSHVVLHELVHSIRLGSQFNPSTIDTDLPSGAGEVYGFAQMATLPDADKPYNAEGYAMLGTAMWLARNDFITTVQNGEQVGLMWHPYPVRFRPNPMLHF